MRTRWCPLLVLGTLAPACLLRIDEGVAQPFDAHLTVHTATADTWSLERTWPDRVEAPLVRWSGANNALTCEDPQWQMYLTVAGDEHTREAVFRVFLGGPGCHILQGDRFSLNEGSSQSFIKWAEAKPDAEDTWQAPESHTVCGTATVAEVSTTHLRLDIDGCEGEPVTAIDITLPQGDLLVPSHDRCEPGRLSGQSQCIGD